MTETRLCVKRRLSKIKLWWKSWSMVFSQRERISGFIKCFLLVVCAVCKAVKIDDTNIDSCHDIEPCSKEIDVADGSFEKSVCNLNFKDRCLTWALIEAKCEISLKLFTCCRQQLQCRKALRLLPSQKIQIQLLRSEPGNWKHSLSFHFRNKELYWLCWYKFQFPQLKVSVEIFSSLFYCSFDANDAEWQSKRYHSATNDTRCTIVDFSAHKQFFCAETPATQRGSAKPIANNGFVADIQTNKLKRFNFRWKKFLIKTSKRGWRFAITAVHSAKKSAMEESTITVCKSSTSSLSLSRWVFY